jgi:hypothetical protein
MSTFLDYGDLLNAGIPSDDAAQAESKCAAYAL